jgi:hypothetical protein
MNFGGLTAVPKETPDASAGNGRLLPVGGGKRFCRSTTDPVIAYPALTKGEIYEYNGDCVGEECKRKPCHDYVR